MEEPATKFQYEPDLVDILWRQDVDLGVEREVFDGCLRQRTEEARRAREREQKRERELKRIMQRLQKLDKETGEFLPSTSSVNSQVMPSTVSTQQSPIIQNPLLTALLSQKAVSEVQAFGELPSVPDLQYYLDLLESESPLENIIDMCSNNPSREENSADELCDLSELTKTISESLDVAQPLLSTSCTSLLETCIPTLSDSTNSPLNAIFSSSPPETLNQMTLTTCQSAFSEFCPELTNTFSINTSTQNQPEESSGPARWETSRTLPCVTDSPVPIGFDDSASSGSVDLDTSLYATDTYSDQSEEELVCIQSNYIDLLPISLDETEKREPNLKKMRGSRRVCRDEQRARALGLPLNVHDIITLPVDAFNEAVDSSKLSKAQLTLIRDIRRRGKNKMAAQSCRKRKLDGLVDLEEEVEALKRQKDQGEEERERNTTDLRDTKEKLRKLYNEVFSQLRNEHGNPYDPKRYKLHLSTDGTVYLLPRSNKNNTLREDSPVAKSHMTFLS